MFCFYYKNMITRHLDSDTPISAGVLEHIEHCSSCRSLYRSHMEISDRLVKEFEPGEQDIPDILRERIISECKRISPRAVAPTVQRRIWPKVLGAAAAAVLLAVCLWLVSAGQDRIVKERRIADEPTRPGGGSLAVAWLITRGQGTPGDAAVVAEEGLEKPDVVAQQLTQKFESWYSDFQDFCSTHEEPKQE